MKREPWAKFRTPMTPKTVVRPIEMRKSSIPHERPFRMFARNPSTDAPVDAVPG
jgi:hypothetical protein